MFWPVALTGPGQFTSVNVPRKAGTSVCHTPQSVCAALCIPVLTLVRS